MERPRQLLVILQCLQAVVLVVASLVAVVAVVSVLFRVAQVLASHSCSYNFIEEAGTKVLASQLLWDC